MDRRRKPAVGGEPVGAQDAVPVPADHPLQDGRAAVGVDGVSGRAITDPIVEPGGAPADPPARLVRRHLRGGSDVGQDRVIIRRQPDRRPPPAPGAGPAAQGDAEQVPERCRDFTVRQARVFVQHDRRGLGGRADLAGGRPEGVGRLQPVPALDPPAALPAVADVNPEAPYDRPPGDVGRILVGDGGLDDRPPAVRAGVGQRGVVAFIDLIGWRRRQMGVLPVGVPGLAAGRLGVGLGRPLAERRGLPLAGAEGLVAPPGQVSDLRPQGGDFDHQSPTARARRFVHASSVAIRPSLSCARSRPRPTSAVRRAVINYPDRSVSRRRFRFMGTLRSAKWPEQRGR
jgi:hypothetical protein